MIRHTTSPALSKKLRDAGIKQESIFCYYGDTETLIHAPSRKYGEEYLAAFLADEVLKMMPDFLESRDSNLHVIKGIGEGRTYCVTYISIDSLAAPVNYDKDLCFYSDSLSEALGNLLLELKERGLA